jgi:hypothetical protein
MASSPSQAGNGQMELKRVVAAAWTHSTAPQTRFAQILRAEAKAVGHYHDPGAVCHNEQLREEIKSISLSNQETRRLLWELSKGYETVPEAEVSALSQGGGR